jgi:hypothetical protein
MLARRGGRDYREAIPLSAFAWEIRAAKHNRTKQLRRTGASLVATHCSQFFYTAHNSSTLDAFLFVVRRSARGMFGHTFDRRDRRERPLPRSRLSARQRPTRMRHPETCSTNRIPWPDAPLRQIAGSPRRQRGAVQNRGNRNECGSPALSN